MVRAKFLAVTISSGLLIIACSPTVIIDRDFPCQFEQAESSSQSHAVAIYVDGTPSMQGYVTDSASNYIKTLDALDGIFLASQTQYYRLGENSKPIDRQDYRQAMQSKFYDGSDPKYPLLKVSQIETAIHPHFYKNVSNVSPISGNRIVAIITDLYQKKADLNTVIKAIRDQYLDSSNTDNNNVVGILAVKSNFNGKIYDIGITEKELAWNGIHPFYVIFLGSYHEISSYFQKLEEKLKDIKDKHLVILASQDLVREPFHSQKLPDLPEGLIKQSFLQHGRVALELKTPSYNMLEIEQHINEDLKIDHSFSLESPDYVLPLDSTSLQLSPNIQYLNDRGQAESVDREPIAIELQSTSESSQELKFAQNIKLSEFPKPGIYAVSLNVVGRKLETKDWWKEWSSAENSIDGSKTHNFVTFMNELKTATEDRIAKREVDRLCYAIQKN
jgi:hypothetical protein